MTMPINLNMNINPLDLLKFFKECWGQSINPRQINPVLEPMKRCKGLIAFVSAGSGASSAKEAINFHKHGPDNLSGPMLHHIWLLYSPLSQSGAEELKDYAEKRNIKCSKKKLDITDDVHNIKRIKDQLDKVADEAIEEGMRYEDIAIDLTGGSKVVSLGFFLSALIYGFKLQIMIPNEIDENGRAVPDAGSKPFSIELRCNK